MKKLVVLLFVVSALFAAGCGRNVRSGLSGYNSVFFKTLPLNPNDYAKYGYSNQKDWQKQIDYTRRYLWQGMRNNFQTISWTFGPEPNEYSEPIFRHAVIEVKQYNVAPCGEWIVADVEIISPKQGLIVKKKISARAGEAKTGFYSWERKYRLCVKEFSRQLIEFVAGDEVKESSKSKRKEDKKRVIEKKK